MFDRVSFFLLIGLLMMALPEAGRAEGSPGDKVLAIMDDSMTKLKDQRFEFDMLIEEPGRQPRAMTFQVSLKGNKNRRVEFTAPGDVQGMRLLSLSLTQQYIYLPAYRKVRRIASHVKDQGFMGSSYSYDEMAIVTYGDVFQGTLVSENDKEWKVVGTLREGQDFRYPKLEFTILKETKQPSEIKYFNDKGVLLKTETRTDYDCNSETCNPKLMVMTDHTRNNLVSKLVRKAWKWNLGIPDSFFTVRDLQKGS